MRGSKIRKNYKLHYHDFFIYWINYDINCSFIDAYVGQRRFLFRYQMKAVLYSSMEPGIQTGSVIAIKEPDYKFEKNDVITFIMKEEKIVTHRIDQVRNDDKSYVTKGDANDAADMEPVKQDSIIGICVYFYNFKEWFNFIVDTTGYRAYSLLYFPD